MSRSYRERSEQPAAHDHETAEIWPMDYDRWLGTTRRSRRRKDWQVVRHSIDREDLEPVEGEKQYLATVIWTLAWYVVPLTLFAAWTMAFDGDTGTACADPVNGACPPVRMAAVHAMMNALPQLCLAVIIGLLVALLIRLGSGAWRPATAGFSAAVIGAGAATILTTIMSS